MSRPAKTANIIKMENKAHRTKKELKQRENGEKALLCGSKINERPEVRKNPDAHKEFLRIVKLLNTIDKNDSVYEPVINRYCLMQAECLDFEHKRESFYNDLEELIDDKDSFIDKDELSTYYKLKNDMQKQIVSLDKQIQSKRKMLLDIEKENVMTIAAALRSIPKKADDKPNALLEALNG